MRIHAVFNRDGGTFRTMDMEAFCEEAKTVFSAAGHHFDCEMVPGRTIADVLSRAARRDDLDAMIAGGGDGTISTAAAIAWKAGMPLGVVPAGTMNLFARSLKVPLDVHAALEGLAAGTVGAVDIATANGKAFIHQFSVGLHPRMVRLRNSYEFASRLGKIRASVRAALGVIFDPPIFEADYEVDGTTAHERVSAISVSNNPFGDNALLYADDLTAGVLGFYRAAPLTPAATARLVMDILRGRRRENPDLDERDAREVRLRFPKLRRSARAVMDGEIMPLEREVVFRIHAGELKVLLPGAAAASEGDATPAKDTVAMPGA